MRFTDFISVKLTLFLIVGILLDSWLNVTLIVAFTLLLILTIILIVSFKKQKRNTFPLFGVVSLLTTCAVGIFSTSLSNDTNLTNHYSNQLSNANGVWHLKITQVLKPTSYSNRYFVDATLFENNPVKGKLLLTFTSDTAHTTFAIDDELLVLGKLGNINPPLNPNQFDYKSYLKKKGILHQIKSDYSQIHLKSGGTKTLKGIASNFRAHIISKLEKENFGSDELGIIQALLLGQRNDISATIYDNYKKAGAVHILAVSGLHIGILLLLLQFILKPLERLPKGKTIKLIVIVLLLWSFAFVAGLSPSVVRAVTMFSFIAYAFYLNRPANMFNIIALSMFFILLVKPLFLFEVGFQMSYAAVFSIVWIYPKLQRFWYPKHFMTNKLWQLLSISIAAQLGVLPISLFYFHQFPALFFVSNLVIVPFLGIVLGIGILLIVLSLLNILPSFLVSTFNFLIHTMNTVIGWVAKQEEFVFSNIPFDLMQVLLTYLMIFGLIVSVSKPKFKNVSFLLSTIMVLSGWSVYKQYELKEKEQLVLAHQTKNSVLLHQNAGELHVYSHNENETQQRLVNDICTAERLTKVTYDTLQNYYLLNGKCLFVMDSLAVYPKSKGIDYLLLTQSPKVNLERVIDSLHPKMILADGSNYRSYIQRWKVTCQKKKLPFHYTGERGAYDFEGFND